MIGKMLVEISKYDLQKNYMIVNLLNLMRGKFITK